MSAKQRILRGHAPSNINLRTCSFKQFAPLKSALFYNHSPLLTMMRIRKNQLDDTVNLAENSG